MKKYERDFVYYTGSEMTLKRTIYIKDGRYYCKFYGQFIELVKAAVGYKTKENY